METFSTEQSDAWLDVWAFGGLHVPELILDMTVRHPVVARYQPGASQRTGVAAAAGETDKQARYPPEGYCFFGGDMGAAGGVSRGTLALLGTDSNAAGEEARSRCSGRLFLEAVASHAR